MRLAVLIGLLAQLALGAWWIDALTSLVIVGLLTKEGRDAWSGEEVDDRASDPLTVRRPERRSA